MAKYQIYTVGKLRAEYRTIFALYQKRLPQLNVIEVKNAKANNPDERIKCEGESLNLAAQKGAGQKGTGQVLRPYRIALDKAGAQFSSEQFADMLTQQGAGIVAFFIGGADGLSETIKQQADRVMSFGKMTFPHELARLMLLEQIYRAEMIASRHPYHK